MKTIALFSIVGLLFMASGCPAKPGTTVSATSPQEVVATINGQPITGAELMEAAKSQLQKLDTQIYQIKRNTLDTMIEDRLIADAAKKAGQSVDAYLEAEITKKVTEPTEAQIKSLYDSRKGKDTPPLAKVKDQIANYLKQNQQSAARQNLIAQLTKAADVKINMEPPRVDIANAKDAPFLGPKDAKVTIVEFSDYQCPFCQRVRPTIWRINDEYKDKIKYVFRDFPLSFHNFARKAHEAAHCAGDQGKYFEYNRKLFDNQQKLAIDDLKKYAHELQLDAAKFTACLDSGKHAAKIDEDIQVGAAAGVSGTPSFFINGVQLSGAQPYEAFKELIDGELKR